jgi:superfamily II DNA or RNA helicase
VDEAHFSCSPTYSDIIDTYKKQGSFVIGKTATPWRMSGEGLGRHFKDMVTGPTVQ